MWRDFSKIKKMVVELRRNKEKNFAQNFRKTVG